MGMVEDAMVKVAEDVAKDDPGLIQKAERWVEGMILHLVHANGARTPVAVHPEAGVAPVPQQSWQNPVVGVELAVDEAGTVLTRPVPVLPEAPVKVADEALSSPAAMSGGPVPVLEESASSPSTSASTSASSSTSASASSSAPTSTPAPPSASASSPASASTSTSESA